MIRPRFRKVLADLLGNPTRSILVVASIAIGLFAVGTILVLHSVIQADMAAGYRAISPANIQILAEPFDQDLVDRLGHLDGVKNAEGARVAGLRVKTGPDEYVSLSLKALADFDDTRINRLDVEQGTWPPQKREIAVDRSKLGDLRAGLGDSIQVELPNGDLRTLKIVAVVHDQTIGAGIPGGFFLAPAQGYIDQATLEILDLPATFNTVYVTVIGDGEDLDHIEAVAADVRRAIEQNDRHIVNSLLKRSSEHPNAIYTQAIAGVLVLLGLLVVFLSAFLITNTLSALLNQQAQQIGVMKAVGARRAQIIAIYMILIFAFGLVAILIAVPLADLAARRLLEYLSYKINFNLQAYHPEPVAVIVQVAIGLLVPQLAGFIPILHGTRVSVQEAISGFSHSTTVTRKSRFERWLEGIRRLPRPMLISLRNTFRRKSRLALTLITLCLAGAVFIATFNVRGSLTAYIYRIRSYYLADVNLTLDRPYRIEKVQHDVLGVPGVGYVEGWAAARSELILDDGLIGDSVSLLGPPVSSELVQPITIRGRWIEPGDENAIALNERFLSRFPNLKPGGTVRLRVNGKETEWVVVGFFQLAGKSGGFLAYTNYDYLARVIGQPGQALVFRVAAAQPGLGLDQQKALARQVERALRARGYRIADISAGNAMGASASEGLTMLTFFLLSMAILTALVGSIGLMGTMGMNVMERTREIGVMRAIGASDRSVTNLVIVEGLIIGLMSWVGGTLLSIPISSLMSDTISLAIFEARSTFTYTPAGPVVWLAVVLALSALGSVMPARSAARLTIREVLAYE
jgi:putative ABC transport system permease protein